MIIPSVIIDQNIEKNEQIVSKKRLICIDLSRPAGVSCKIAYDSYRHNGKICQHSYRT